MNLSTILNSSTSVLGWRQSEAGQKRRATLMNFATNQRRLTQTTWHMNCRKGALSTLHDVTINVITLDRTVSE